MLSLLRHRDFALLWWGSLISMLGNWMLFTALPVMVYQLTDSAQATSITVIMEVAPRILFGVLAGVYVDRWDRRLTMIITNLLMAVSLLPLVVVRSESLLWVVYVAVGLQAIFSQFFGPAENAFLPRVVPADRLPAANALNTLNNNLARMAGPVLGGVAVAFTDLTGVVLLDCASFFFAALAIFLVKTSGRVEADPQRQVSAMGAFARLGHEVRDGLDFIRVDRRLTVLFSCTTIMSFGEGVVTTMIVVWVVKIMGGDTTDVGALLGAQGVGGVPGAILVGAAAVRFGPRRLVGYGAIGLGLGDLLIFNSHRVTDSFWPSYIIIALIGVAVAGLITGTQTLMQQSTPDWLRGRVSGAMGTSGAVAQVAGAGLVVLIGDRVDPVWLLSIQSAAYALAGLISLLALPEDAPQTEPDLAVG